VVIRLIHESILDLIGETPLVRLQRIGAESQATLLAKIEAFNPISVKDRPVLRMIEDGERRGLINQETTIIEATSGNTGMALAFLCAVKGYRLIICMNEAMSEERKQVLQAFGAELVLTPPGEHTRAAKARAMELAREIPNSFYVNQHGNPANTEAHVCTTAEEIWRDTEGDVDLVVAALGTTGTACGIARGLKAKNVRVVGVEPSTAPMLSSGAWTPHKLPGTSPGFVPDLYEPEMLDEIVTADPESEAYPMCRRLAREEGLLVGVSSGAVAVAALKLAERTENRGKTIVCIFADSGQRYLSIPGLFDSGSGTPAAATR